MVLSLGSNLGDRILYIQTAYNYISEEIGTIEKKSSFHANDPQGFESKNEFISNPIKVKSPVDTTGAGDLFASGFLYGYINKYSIKECGNLGSKAAAEIITYYGARPKISLKNLIN